MQALPSYPPFQRYIYLPFQNGGAGCGWDCRLTGGPSGLCWSAAVAASHHHRGATRAPKVGELVVRRIFEAIAEQTVITDMSCPVGGGDRCSGLSASRAFRSARVAWNRCSIGGIRLGVLFPSFRVMTSLDAIPLPAR